MDAKTKLPSLAVGDYGQPEYLDGIECQYTIFHEGKTLAFVMDAEVARRLVACWNACQGMSTDVLENIVTLGDTIPARFEERDKAEAEANQKFTSLLTSAIYAESLLLLKNDKTGALDVLRGAISRFQDQDRKSVV